MKYLTKGLGNDRLFGLFEEICSIPHPSGNEKGIADFVCAKAEKNGYRFIRDAADNVIVFVPGSEDKADSEPVMIQGHTDMVFVTDGEHSSKDRLSPIELKLDGKKLSAVGTSLGADDGVAVALMLAIMEDKTLVHPPLELIFTTGEEIGLLGADALDASVLKGNVMINVDSDCEGVATIGCAGGLRIGATRDYVPEKGDFAALKLSVGGLRGGHSGGEIDLGRANANRVAAEIIYGLSLTQTVKIAEMNGGKVDNAICDFCSAVIAAEDIRDAKTFIESAAEKMLPQIRKVDTDAYITAEDARAGELMPAAASKDLVTMLFVCPDGPCERMPGDRSTLLSSSNAAIVRAANGKAELAFSVRSPQAEAKKRLAGRIAALLEKFGFSCSFEGEYPGWYPKEDSKLQRLYSEEYTLQTGKKPQIISIHAGLECGIFAEKIKDLDAISIGPDNESIHSPKETLDLESFDRTCELVIRMLKKL
ncbi:MAG: beta-Ala-His dipeptidase [Clostridia bacterium]|nr:beta-Ala-His dipeptidase [Clostridia bacterium]